MFAFKKSDFPNAEVIDMRWLSDNNFIQLQPTYNQSFYKLKGYCFQNQIHR
jgi:hypothetical protein